MHAKSKPDYMKFYRSKFITDQQNQQAQQQQQPQQHSMGMGGGGGGMM